MGIMNVISKFRKKDEVYEELAAQDKASSKVSERKLSSNERALNKILAKKREEQIKSTLDKHYKKEDSDYWHKDVITQKDIFKSKVGQSKNEILNQKNIFTNQRTLFINHGGGY